MKNWLSSPLTIIVLIALCLSLFINGVQYQDAKDTTRAWQEAAVPVFQSRQFNAETATPAELAAALNPCYAFSYLERSRRKQMGCDSHGQPKGAVYVQASFVAQQDQELDASIWWY